MPVDKGKQLEKTIYIFRTFRAGNPHPVPILAGTLRLRA